MAVFNLIFIIMAAISTNYEMTFTGVLLLHSTHCTKLIFIQRKNATTRNIMAVLF